MGVTDARLASQRSLCERKPRTHFSVSAAIGTYYSLRWSTSCPLLLENRQSGHSYTKTLKIFTRRQFEHDRIAGALRYHPGLPDPLIPKALETHHRAIPEVQQIQQPSLQVPSQCRDHEAGLIRRQRAGGYMGQAEPVLGRVEDWRADGRVRWKIQPLSRWSAVRLP